MINIYNEVEYAEKMLKEGFLTRRKLYELSVLAKYYYNSGKSKNEVFELLNQFCEENMENYNKVLYFDKIQNIANTSKNTPIKSISSIDINRSDMDIIESLEDVDLKKLVLAIIVLTKIKILTTGGRYVNNKYSYITRTSKIKSNSDIRLLLSKLVGMGIITICINGSILYNKEIDNSEVLFSVKDFDNIGYYLMNYLSHKYIECEDCGSMMRKRANSHKYCTKCARLRNLKSKLEYYNKK